MAEDLTKLEQTSILNRLAIGFGVDATLVAEISRRLSQGKHDASMRDQAERRVSYLERFVPPEIANPPAPVPYRPRRTGD